MHESDIDRLRVDVFFRILDQSGATLIELASERAALFGEHAARIARAAVDGIKYFDRTGTVRDPRPDQQARGAHTEQRPVRRREHVDDR